MIKFNSNIFIRSFLFLLLIFTNITGLVALLVGSAVSEGCIVLFAILLMIHLLLQKRTYDFIDYSCIFIAGYSIIITLIMIIFFDYEVSSLIGIYYYTLPCIIFLNRNHSFFKKNIDFYFHCFLFFILLNSIWAIYQTINPFCAYPVQTGTLRVRGFMKSTLNYSGLLGASFFPLLFYEFKPKIFKFISSIILLIGSFLTISKGFFTNIITGFFFSYPTQAISSKIEKRQITNIAKAVGIGAIVLFIAIIAIIQTGTIEKYDQFINFLNFSTNGSNVQRANSWASFFNYFPINPFGYGVGQIHSGTDFVFHSVNFESYALDTIYSIGIVAFLYFALPIIYFVKNSKYLSTKYSQFYLMYLIGIYIQNLIQVSMLTPATTVITWFNFIFLMNYFKQKTIEQNLISEVKE